MNAAQRLAAAMLTQQDELVDAHYLAGTDDNLVVIARPAYRVTYRITPDGKWREWDRQPVPYVPGRDADEDGEGNWYNRDRN